MRKSLLGLLAVVALAAPSFADGLMINGKPFEGTWTRVGGRVYVNVDSLTNALKLPHQHNVLNWQLSEKTAKGNPYQLSVNSGGQALPTVRFGGATMVDVISAANALKLPVHHDFSSKTLEIGRPYMGQSYRGEYYRENFGGYLRGADRLRAWDW